jgi:protein gp37
LDWLLLTKRPQNLMSRMNLAMNGNFDLNRTFGEHMTNVWLGVSAENQEMYEARVPEITAILATVHFVSVEPMLGPVVIEELPRPDWIICGGESGPGARPMPKQ